MNFHKIIHDVTFSLRKYVCPPLLNKKDAQQCIIDCLKSDSPCMIARFGSSEIQGVVNGFLPLPFSYFLRKRTWKHLINNAGFFPVNRKTVKKFAKLMIDDMRDCDVLASWRIEEALFKNQLKNSKKVELSMLGPADEGNSWFSELEGKRVLVVSPFAELIKMQYTKRNLIWGDRNVLPEYKELLTLKSVNSIRGNCDFDSWFDALDWMENEIKKMDFDIAILGCGAYGFPLAARIKRMGKKAVHVGGATQLIFGIKGKRWENLSFINEHWVSPRVEDRPKGWEKVEGGCYW